MTAAIRLEGVRKQFGDHKAVDGLSFEVEQGSIFGLLGRNGAGKSTTIRMIMDIIRPDSGSITLFGKPIDEETKDRIGYLPEERGLYPKMKVLDLLQFQGSIKGLELKQARSRASDWLDRLDLADWKTKKVEDLSKGMQQKVQFVAALMHEPDLLILDEPFSGMDPVNQELFKQLIAEINKSGTTIIFSTHVMASAEWLCRDITLIDHGNTVLLGNLDEIKQRFGGRTLRLRLEGDMAFVNDLPGVERTEVEEPFVLAHLVEQADPQQILHGLIQRGPVRHFEIVRPTLHNIFIQEVGEELTRA